MRCNIQKESVVLRVVNVIKAKKNMNYHKNVNAVKAGCLSPKDISQAIQPSEILMFGSANISIAYSKDNNWNFY